MTVVWPLCPNEAIHGVGFVRQFNATERVVDILRSIVLPRQYYDSNARGRDVPWFRAEWQVRARFSNHSIWRGNTMLLRMSTTRSVALNCRTKPTP